MRPAMILRSAFRLSTPPLLAATLTLGATLTPGATWTLGAAIWTLGGASRAQAETPAAPQAPVSPIDVPEPEGFWRGPLRGYTPKTLKGARVIDAAGLARLAESGAPVLIDVGPADRRPPALGPDAVWMPAHRTIPGAVWMPGAGEGTPDPAFADAFARRAAALTGGDLSRPVVAFCHPECWGGWNAARRLVMLGYKNVYWLPDGVEGWQEDHALAAAPADAEWAKAAPGAQPQ
ncbi:rhodanese-like domain-containing protein [Methylocella sp.]|uniref:rhodanese-like domain-containing protein n=1 Tax=Methylocella sp. TaxID=1978226 RepID=UPI003783FD68